MPLRWLDDCSKASVMSQPAPIARIAVLLLLTCLATVANVIGCSSSPLDSEDASLDSARDTRGEVEGTSCPTDFSLPPTPCYDCAALEAGADGGCTEGPSMFWGWANPEPPTGKRYPFGCTVSLPVKNPYYPGPQTCTCQRAHPAMPGGGSWACGI